MKALVELGTAHREKFRIEIPKNFSVNQIWASAEELYLYFLTSFIYFEHLFGVITEQIYDTDEDDEDVRGIYEGGHWTWDEKNQGLNFIRLV